MKHNKLPGCIKTKACYVALFGAASLLLIMCKNHEKKIANLDNQISTLNKEISNTKDFHNARVPKRLQHTQTRYNQASDSLNTKSDTVDICIANNDSLIARAFDKYAVRVGRDFLASHFLTPTDVATFQKYVAQLDTMDFVMEMARQRVLRGTASLHDLSYFFELFDFDSVNAELENKLGWNFYNDTVMDDTENFELCVLGFNDSVLNNALQAEENLLNAAWAQQKTKTPDTVAHQDSVSHNEVIENFEQTNVPNFSIPEFDSVRVQYLRNDSLIRAYNHTFENMLKAEDTLEQYRQQMIRKRDSLVEQRQELER